ncbi:MAG TPA: uracil-DNA glycosylase [Armatimonadota bacterium]|nr:uracil-DNA glycosylase [Armatimonadota bacterium]
MERTIEVGSSPPDDPLLRFTEEVHACTRCPRLAEYLTGSRRDHPAYWSRPLSGFGDPNARLYILGLAPAYHGGNRTGRVFTGDDSGRWLWGALHEAGACSERNSTSTDQPLVLNCVYVGNAVRCAPPGNRPTAGEFAACRDYLRRELELLPRVTVVLALGKLAHDSYLKLRGQPLSRFPFGHGAVHQPPHGPTLIDSYHPSRQNTFTRVLTWKMWAGVIAEALRLAAK